MRRRFRSPGTYNIRIKGRSVNISLAQIVYRCEVCLGLLRRVNAGLKCETNPAHKGFIHRDDAQALIDKRQQNINDLQSVYEIVDGKVQVKDANHRTD